MHAHGAGFRPGDRWLVCDRCGFDYRLSQMKKEWNGLIVCHSCYEARHPQDFIRAKQDTITPRGPIRPPPPLSFVTRTYIDEFNDDNAVAGIAVTGLAKAGVDKTVIIQTDNNIPAGNWGADL